MLLEVNFRPFWDYEQHRGEKTYVFFFFFFISSRVNYIFSFLEIQRVHIGIIAGLVPKLVGHCIKYQV